MGIVEFWTFLKAGKRKKIGRKIPVQKRVKELGMMKGGRGPISEEQNSRHREKEKVKSNGGEKKNDQT